MCYKRVWQPTKLHTEIFHLLHRGIFLHCLVLGREERKKNHWREALRAFHI